MKTLLSLLAVVLLCSMSVFAQKPIQDTIPQLKEWWVAPAAIKGLGRYGVSHIPNFYHGKDAMAVSINDGTMVTWLNRFPGDTTNIFSWKGGGPVLQGDYNGDGIVDYFGGGYIYQGITNGEPPDTATILNRFSISPGFVADINHDGYDDIVSSPSSTNSELVGILYGASDFKDMKYKVIPGYGPLDSTMVLDHHYVGADGDMRFIAFSYTKTNDWQRHFNGYVLFRAHWNKGDTFPEVTMLSKIIRYKDTDIPFDRGGAVYTSKHTSKKFFIAKEFLGMNLNRVLIYDISTDIFSEYSRININYVIPIILKLSINQDSFEDWILAGSTYCVTHSGGAMLDTSLLAEYQAHCTGSSGQGTATLFEAIGDVNGDGINDMAIAASSNIIPNCFRIVLGVSKSTGITDSTLNQENTFSLTDTSPHPLIRGKNAVISTNIAKHGVYILELYNSVGKYSGELHRHYYEAGIQRMNVEISQFPISVGTYILRLRNENGVVVGERTIIIE